MTKLVHRNIHTAGRTILGLVTDVLNGDIDLDPPYQRGDTWTTEQRQALIRSILMGIPVAAIVLNRRWDNSAWTAASHGDQRVEDTGLGGWACIDGKQRLTTCVRWMTDELAVPGDWFGLGIREISYGALLPVEQRRWKNVLTLPVAEATLGTVEEEAEVYRLINSAGTAHTAADLAKARAIEQAGTATT